MQISLPLAALLLSAVLVAGAQTASRTAPTISSASSARTAPSDLQALVIGLEAAQRENHAHMVPFTVRREYLLFSGNDKQPKGTVVAEVHFQPPTTKSWEIKQTSGTGRAAKVVKNVLEREAKYAHDGKVAISRQDYQFRYAGNDDNGHRPCYILEIIPKRNQSDLLRGRLWVDRDTFLIHRFEGQLATSPSWWIKDLKLSTTYGNVGGMWMQTASKGVAEVRVFGLHTMTGRTLSYSAARPVLEGPAADLTRLARLQRLRSYRPPSAAPFGDRAANIP
jgi:hypothetical protein